MVTKSITCCMYKDIIGETKATTIFVEYFKIIRRC